MVLTIGYGPSALEYLRTTTGIYNNTVIVKSNMSTTTSSPKLLVSLINSSSPIMEGAENFGRWKKWVQAVMVAHDVQYLVGGAEVKHTSAFKRKPSTVRAKTTNTPDIAGITEVVATTTSDNIVAPSEKQQASD